MPASHLACLPARAPIPPQPVVLSYKEAETVSENKKKVGVEGGDSGR